MDTEKFYPVSLSLAGRECLVAGLGSVGARKLHGLIAANAKRIQVFDPNPEVRAKYGDLLSDARITLKNRSVSEDDIRSSFLVFAATGSHEENLRIAKICAKLNILCNSVTDPQHGSFILPAVIRKGELVATISTNGQSPALARIWKKELECWLATKEKTAWILGRLRAPLLDLNFPQEENARIFRALGQSCLEIWLADNKIDKCGLWLKSQLPSAIHGEIDTILHEYVNAFS